MCILAQYFTHLNNRRVHYQSPRCNNAPFRAQIGLSLGSERVRERQQQAENSKHTINGIDDWYTIGDRGSRTGPIAGLKPLLQVQCRVLLTQLSVVVSELA